MSDSALVWFRTDLRLADNPALQAALERSGSVIPVFIWSPEEEGKWQPGSASKWWLHQSLTRLAESLRERGSRLIVRRGPTLPAIRELLDETGASAVYWNSRYEPAALARDRGVRAALTEEGTIADCFDSLLFEPGSVFTRQGQPYKVFTAFWNACLASPAPQSPRAMPEKIQAPRRWPASFPLGELGLEPSIDWAGGLESSWCPGERGAKEALERFVNESLPRYSTNRDRPDLVGTSRLSPHLHFGEIGIHQVWSAIQERRKGRFESGECYLRELGWREFAHHLLYHFPHTAELPLRTSFANFPWRSNPDYLRAWQRGRTGFPIVDAGMRELWHTGWMHNRVRMIVASFLVKDLLIPWQEGAEWFWDTLVDANLANNTLGWQWVAGCGADAAPYFRIFNPISQGETFDPKGSYVRRWLPELKYLPQRWVYQPWEAPADVLRKAGIELGRTYPHPLVDHSEARARALEALQQITE